MDNQQPRPGWVAVQRLKGGGSHCGLRYSLDPFKYAERRGIIVNGSAGFGKRVTCQISRNGDLINRIYLQVTLPAPGSGVEYVDYVGLRLLKGVEIEIGGQRINSIGAEKYQAASSMCKEAGKTFVGAQGLRLMPQMLVVAV